MKRREFLECAALLVSGASASRLGLAITPAQQQMLAAAPDYADRELNYFTTAQRRLVEALAETIIPRTETPGATDAGVPRFIEAMVAEWLTDEERAIFNAGLAGLDARAETEWGAAFPGLDEGQRVAVLESLEEEASDSSWYEAGNTRRDFVSDAPFICQLKELTVWGFFTSEIGGTQVLRHQAMPMYFDGDTALDPDASTWMPYLV